MINWLSGFLSLLRVSNQILTAGIAITAFALLLHALSFNLRVRVARTFALILGCVVIVFTAEAIGSASSNLDMVDFWLRLQWVGIILLPATYLNFSDAVLAMTGKPSRRKRKWAIRFTYLISFIFLISLPFYTLIGHIIVEGTPAPYLQPTPLTYIFLFYYITIMVMTWYNFIRAFQRSTTPTSKRRMGYLIIGSLSPALGSFPYMLFGSGFASRHLVAFWGVAVLSSLLVLILIVIMAYSVAFFGVPWPDRVVKSRLFKWLMRGPVTAILTLALATIVRRAGENLGTTYTAAVPIVTVGTIILSEFLITLFNPLMERRLFYGNDREELEIVNSLQEHLLTKNDLHQFLETILSAICDMFQARGGYIAFLNTEQEMLLVVEVGENDFDNQLSSNHLTQMISQFNGQPDMFKQDNNIIIPLHLNEGRLEESLLGLLCISDAKNVNLESEQNAVLSKLTTRASLALRDYRTQQQVFQSLQSLTPQMEFIQNISAASRFNKNNLLSSEISPPTNDINQWVKDALTHYWGGPKLTESPLLNLHIVQLASQNYNGNTANALRHILREAIDHTRPAGEQHFTGEWILYNILEMKFLEGRKVREIALRLAMSEADLYRKQRIAVEAVANAILEMENSICQTDNDNVQTTSP